MHRVNSKPISFFIFYKIMIVEIIFSIYHILIFKYAYLLVLYIHN